MRQGLVFSSRSRSRRNRRNRRSMKARRTARRTARRASRRSAQRGGNYAYRIPGDATRDFQRMEDDGFSQPIMITQEEAEKLAEDQLL